VAALATGVGSEVATRSVGHLDLTPNGIPGDRHRGFERKADARVPWYHRGEMIRNERQVSIVSQEELDAIASGLGIQSLEAEWLGANVIVSGLASLSFLPRGTLLFFQSGAVLVVTGQNAPCRIAGRSVAQENGGAEEMERRFVEVSRRLRGVVAAVDRPGRIRTGDEISVRVPEQWIWQK
jgi:MOSC domain-containing protein YiiM